MHKLLFLVLTIVGFGYALEYVDNQMQMKPYYSPMPRYQYNTGINQTKFNQAMMLNDYGLPMGVPQASRPYSQIETNVKPAPLVEAKQRYLPTPTS